METLSLKALNRATLARQLLLAREEVKPLAAVEKLVGLQAQQAKPPFVGLWSRVQGFTREQLLALLRGKQVVRATLMRGTLHLMSARDFCALRATLQPMLTQGMTSILRDRAKALDVPALLAEARAFFTAKPETFEALRDQLVRRFPRGEERAMGYAVRMHLPLVQVPEPGQDGWGYAASAPFAVAEEWLGEPLSKERAEQALVLRYLAAFGPATPTDAQAWSGLRGLKETFEALRPKLLTFRDERKRELFDLPKAPRPGEDADAPARFLPDFDNLVLSHDDRRRVLADEHRGKVVTKNLQVRATFLVDGFVAGTWKADRKKQAAQLSLEPFGKLSKPARAALEEEGDALLRFLEPDAGAREVKLSPR